MLQDAVWLHRMQTQELRKDSLENACKVKAMRKCRLLFACYSLSITGSMFTTGSVSSLPRFAASSHHTPSSIVTPSMLSI